MAFKGARTSPTQRQTPPGLLPFVPTTKEQSDFHLFLYSFYSTWKKERSRCFFAARRSVNHHSRQIHESSYTFSPSFTCSSSYSTTHVSLPSLARESYSECHKFLKSSSSSFITSCSSTSTLVEPLIAQPPVEYWIYERRKQNIYESFTSPSPNQLVLPDLVSALEQTFTDDDSMDESNVSPRCYSTPESPCTSPQVERVDFPFYNSTSPFVSRSPSPSYRPSSTYFSTIDSNSLNFISTPSTSSPFSTSPNPYVCPYSSMPVDIVFKIEDFPTSPCFILDSAPSLYYIQLFYHEQFKQPLNNNMFNIAINCIKKYHILDHATIIRSGDTPLGFVFCISDNDFSRACRNELEGDYGFRASRFGKGTVVDELWTPNMRS